MRAFNSTISLKQKICVSCGKPCIWFSRKRCQQCARIEDTLAREEKEDSEDETFSGLIAEADRIYSQYIRLVNSNLSGYVECYTCSEILHWKDAQCGHYMPRINKFLRYDNRVNKVQCKHCNEDLRGNHAAFRIRLEKENPGLTEIIEYEVNLTYKYGRDELRNLITEYTQKVRELKKLKNIK